MGLEGDIQQAPSSSRPNKRPAKEESKTQEKNTKKTRVDEEAQDVGVTKNKKSEPEKKGGVEKGEKEEWKEVYRRPELTKKARRKVRPRDRPISARRKTRRPIVPLIRSNEELQDTNKSREHGSEKPARRLAKRANSKANSNRESSISGRLFSARVEYVDKTCAF